MSHIALSGLELSPLEMCKMVKTAKFHVYSLAGAIFKLSS
jgi:hypothetical protein